MDKKAEAVQAEARLSKPMSVVQSLVLVTCALGAFQIATNPSSAQVKSQPPPASSAQGNQFAPPKNGEANSNRGQRQPQRGNGPAGDQKPDFGGCPYRGRELEMLV